MSEKLKTEIIIWLQYFLIFFLACSIASIVREHNRAVSIAETNGVINDDVIIHVNVSNIIQELWIEYFQWYLVGFVLLSLIRFLLLFIFKGFKRKIK